MKNQTNKTGSGNAPQARESKPVKELNQKQPRVKGDMKKRLKYGGFTGLMAVLVIAVVVALNVAVSLLETSSGLKLDLTSGQMYSISALTENLLKGLDQELTVYSFADDYKQATLVEKTLERYAAAGGKNLALKVVDPAKDVTLQRKFSTESKTVANGTVVLTNRDESLFRVINASDMTYTDSEKNITYWILEQKLTSALMFLTTDIQTKIYYLTGHGELINDPSYTDATAALTARLEEENYAVSTIDLSMSASVLEKGDILMVIGPANDLTEEERDLLIAFLENHGKALFFLDPIGNGRLKNFEAVLDHYMIKMKQSVVYENDGAMHTERSNFELVPSMAEHDITSALISEKYPVYVNESAYFESYAYDSDIITVSTLLSSSNRSVAVPLEDLTADAYLSKLNGYEKESLAVGLAYLGKDGNSTLADAQTRFVVFGSSEIAMGKRQSSIGNVNLIKNCVNWVDNRLDQLAINGPQIDSYALNISNMNTVTVLVTVAIVVIPLLILGGGVLIWLRRKNL